MKSLLLLALLSATLFLTACDTVVVEHRHHDAYYDGGYYGPRPHSAVVVVDRPAYRPAPVVVYGGPRVAYYTDKHGKYYWHNGHKVYVQRW